MTLRKNFFKNFLYFFWHKIRVSRRKIKNKGKKQKVRLINLSLQESIRFEHLYYGLSALQIMPLFYVNYWPDTLLDVHIKKFVLCFIHASDMKQFMFVESLYV